MGILIVLGLVVVVWKVIDLAKQKAVREEMEAAQQGVIVAPEPTFRTPSASFAFEVTLESGEKILETTSAPEGLWIRIGRDGKTERIILKDRTGKIIGRIKVKRSDDAPVPAN